MIELGRSRPGTAIVLAALASALASCSGVYVARIANPRPWYEGRKLDMHVELRLSESLSATTWVSRLGMRTVTVKCGDALVTSARRLAAELFRKVSVHPETAGGQRPVATDVDVVLRPEVHQIGQIGRAVTNFSKLTTTVTIRWTLSDRSGKILWEDTIGAQSTSRAGRWKQRIEEALAGAFANAARAMSTSGRVRALASQ